MADTLSATNRINLLIDVISFAAKLTFASPPGNAAALYALGRLYGDASRDEKRTSAQAIANAAHSIRRRSSALARDNKLLAGSNKTDARALG